MDLDENFISEKDQEPLDFFDSPLEADDATVEQPMPEFSSLSSGSGESQALPSPKAEQEMKEKKSEKRVVTAAIRCLEHLKSLLLGINVSQWSPTIEVETPEALHSTFSGYSVTCEPDLELNVQLQLHSGIKSGKLYGEVCLLNIDESHSMSETSY